MNSNFKNHSPDFISDKYNVEFSSRHDFDGLATTEMTGLFIVLLSLLMNWIPIKVSIHFHQNNTATIN